jgi:hypothetical protein
MRNNFRTLEQLKFSEVLRVYFEQQLKASRLSQKQFADWLGIHRTHFGQALKKNNKRYMRPDYLTALAAKRAGGKLNIIVDEVADLARAMQRGDVVEVSPRVLVTPAVADEVSAEMKKKPAGRHHHPISRGDVPAPRRG